jgi:hypothetical protein
MAVAERSPRRRHGAVWWRLRGGISSPRQERFRAVALAPADVELLEATPTQGADDAEELVAGRPWPSVFGSARPSPARSRCPCRSG